MIYEIIDTRTGERANEYELVQEPWAEKTRGCDWPAFAIDEDGDIILTDDCGNYDMVPEGRAEVRLVIDKERWTAKWRRKQSPWNGTVMVCSKCKETIKSLSGQFPFCPSCGRAMTDEAVQMVMERLEALKDGKDD